MTRGGSHWAGSAQQLVDDRLDVNHGCVEDLDSRRLRIAQQERQLCACKNQRLDAVVVLHPLCNLNNLCPGFRQELILQQLIHVLPVDELPLRVSWSNNVHPCLLKLLRVKVRPHRKSGSKQAKLLQTADLRMITGCAHDTDKGESRPALDLVEHQVGRICSDRAKVRARTH